jgi:hypothetical protein
MDRFMKRARGVAEVMRSKGSRPEGNRFADRARSVLRPRRKSEPDVQPALTEGELAALLQAFADTYTFAIARAIDALVEGALTPRQRRLAQAHRVSSASRVYAIATQPNTELALVDMIVNVSLERAVWSGGLAQDRYGARGALLTSAYDEAYASLRALAARVFSEEQLEALERAVARWLEDHPDRRNVSIVRFDALARYRPASLAEVGAPGRSKLLAQVDEALRTTENLRLLGERAMFVFQRMPTLVNWQVELLYSKMLDEPEPKRLLSDVDGLTRAADRATRIASRALGLAAVGTLLFAGYRAITRRGRRTRRGLRA